MKKFLKISGISLLLILLLLFLAPLLFKGTIANLIKKNLNESLNARVEWASLDISLFRSFPNAQVRLKEFSVVNFAPFEGDTLASGNALAIDIGIRELFKSADEPIEVKSLSLTEGDVRLKVDSLGRENFDIVKDTGNGDTSVNEIETGFKFQLNGYEVRNSRILYDDRTSGTLLQVEQLEHSGKGDFSLDQSELETQTTALVSLSVDDVNYLSQNDIGLDALFRMDLTNQKYTFLENEARINELPLVFDGYVQLNPENTEVDITFDTPSSDFRNFLAVIPKKYVREIEDVSTTGSFSVNGKLNGVIDEERIPKMDIAVSSQNASFKYPDLPKAVSNISIDARLMNKTGLLKDTYLNIGNMTFRIDDEPFSLKGSIMNLATNALVDMEMKGSLNLANIEKVLPLELEQDLSGVFRADVRTRFDQESIEKEKYDNIRSSGTASLSGFSYSDPDFTNPIDIKTAEMTFTPGSIRLKKLEGKTGKTDIAAAGTIQNLIPWIMAKQDLRGVFNVSSNTFDLNDFKSPEVNADNGGTGAKASLAKESVKIPDFMDATINFNAKRVIYDDIVMENSTGSVRIKNETARLDNVKSDLFGGNISLSGNVSTAETTPTFAMDLKLDKVRIADSFSQLDLLQYLAPIAKALDGNLDTSLKLNGNLTDDLTPDFKTLAGNAAARILTAEVNPERTPILSKLNEQIPFLSLDKLSLRDISTAFIFNNGKIEVKPFDIKVDDITITASGTHSLDKSMSYNMDMKVPAKYLGGEVNKLLAKLDPKEAAQMNVNIPVTVSGTALDPKVNVNLQSAVSQLTKQLVNKQKQELKDKGTDILKDFLGGKDTAKDPKDPKETNQAGNKTEEVVKDIIGDIFGKKKKKKDSLQ